MSNPRKKILISRTDAIGDVTLTLPMCYLLKTQIPDAEITFLGRTYTEDLINCCTAVDYFINLDEVNKLNEKERVTLFTEKKFDAILHVFPNKQVSFLAKKAKIPIRIATRNRWYHWLTCNKLLNLSRKNSELHEAQLNLKLFKGLGLKSDYSLGEISDSFKIENIPSLPEKFKNLLDKEKLNIIIHPTSRGSGREWSLEYYKSLIDLLPENRYKIFISGTPNDAVIIESWANTLPNHIHNLAGKMKLSEFISFIYYSDGLVAASTGPLHIAAALKNNALGFYPSIRPIFPKRWAALGPGATCLSAKDICNACKDNPSTCSCMDEILPMQALEIILSWNKINHL